MVKSQYKTTSTQDRSQPEPDPSAKRAFFIDITVDVLYSLARFALLIASLAIANSIDITALTNSNSYLRVQENIALWQEQIIINIVTTNAYNCPQGYEKYSNASWSGNIEGCYCTIQLGVYTYDAVLQGRCSQEQFANQCFSVPAHPSIPYTFWKTKTSICIKRLKNYNFYSVESDIVNPYKYPSELCAVGTDYQIDLISPIDCPITSLANDSTLNQTISALDFSFSREDNYPIVAFKIAEYNFCENFQEDSITPGRRFNYILEIKERQTCSAYDQRTVLLDQQSEPSFLQNNPRVFDTISNLPDYPPPDDHFTYNLGFLRYPAWTYSCRRSQDYNLQAATRQLNLGDSSPSLKASLILLNCILMFQVVYLLYFWISNYLYLKSKYAQGYLYLKDYQIKKINRYSNIGRNFLHELIKFTVVEVVLMIAVIILVVLHSNALDTQTWFQMAEVCTSSLMVTYFATYQQFFGQAMLISITSIFIVVALALLDAGHFLWRRWKGDLEQQPKVQVIEIEVTDQIQQKSNHAVANANTTEQCLAGEVNPAEHLSKKAYQTLLFDIEQQSNSIALSQSVYSSDSSSISD